MKPRAIFHDSCAGRQAGEERPLHFRPWPNGSVLVDVRASNGDVVVLCGLGHGGAAVVERFVTELAGNFRRPLLAILDPGADTRRQGRALRCLDVLLPVKERLSVVWFVGELASSGFARLPAHLSAWQDRGVPLCMFWLRPSDNTMVAWDQALAQSALLRDACDVRNIAHYFRDEGKAHWALLRVLRERESSALEERCADMP